MDERGGYDLIRYLHLVLLVHPEAHADLVHHALIVCMSEGEHWNSHLCHSPLCIASLYITVQLLEHLARLTLHSHH